MTLLTYFHLFQILIILDKVNLISIDYYDDKVTKRLVMFSIMLPIYLAMTRLFRKADIDPLREKYDYDWDKVFKGNIWLIVYIVFSFSFIFILAFWKK